MPRIQSARRAALFLLAVSLAASGCATVAAAGSSLARGVPGFDTRDYPGRAAMQTWRESSPYRWVGYYLPAPCYTGTTWQGRRGELEAMGWGTAVLFIGEQDWAAAGAPSETPAPGTGAAPRCTQSNLTSERGAADAVAAASSAAGEGFGAGSVIYLNVERVETVSPALLSYVRAWMDGVFAQGRYVPGLYAHERNAEQLYAVATAAFASHGRIEVPRLWVASARDFLLSKSPTESPVPFASAWQGAFNQTETWGGVTLRIDASVARSESPSR